MKEKKHCVYALIKNGNCVYIGCTSNINKRIVSHKETKDFDSHTIIKSYNSKKDALNAENAIIRFIGHFKQPGNTNKPFTLDVAKMLYL